MGERDQLKNGNVLPSAQEVETLVATALNEAVAAVSENPNASPFDVFPKSMPGGKRSDVSFELDSRKEPAYREAMARLGPGREANLGAQELGLNSGYVALIDGGTPNKIAAELNVVLDDEVKPRSIILVATPRRVISEAERQVAIGNYGFVDDQEDITEYDVAAKIARSLAGFDPVEDKVLPFSFDTDLRVSAEPTEQFTQLGKVGDADILLMKAIRPFDEGANMPESDRMLGTAGVLEVVDAIMDAHGDVETEIGFVTSATYLPSRRVSVARNAIETDRVMRVLAYGTNEFAKVQGKDAAPTGLNQLAGEAHRVAEELAELRTALRAHGVETMPAEVQARLDDLDKHEADVEQRALDDSFIASVGGFDDERGAITVARESIRRQYGL